MYSDKVHIYNKIVGYTQRQEMNSREEYTPPNLE